MKTNISTTDSENPKNWILGVFYYNKKDQRLFPPKRFKYFGWTVNFANPYSIIVFVFLVFAFFGIFYLFQNQINYN